MEEKTFEITNLSCANCAAKIEEALNKTEGVNFASINFLSKRLVISYSDSTKMNEMIDKTWVIMDKIEPGIKITPKKENNNDIHQDRMNKWHLFILLIGVLIFASTWLLDDANALYLPMFITSYILIGGEVLYKAFRNIINGTVFDENFLMTIATIGAFFVGEYPEAVAVMLFYKVGELFQELAVNHSRRSIKALMDIRPDVAHIAVNDGYKTVPVEAVNIGDVIMIKPGERIPLDGLVVTGESLVDTKALTGESVPLNVSLGMKVLSGCINLNGVLKVKVTTIASESTVAKVLKLVETASSKKAPTEKFITKFAKVYTPFVTVTALLLAVIPPLFVPGALFEDWLYRALIFLVISCPCALVISIPLGFFGGIGAASKQGILIKGGNYLEALNDVEIAVFDKTGTLTEGSFKVTDIQSVSGISKEQLLSLAAHVESASNHPIAQSVVQSFGQVIDQSKISNVKELSGHGLEANLGSDHIIIGNSRYLENYNVDHQEVETLGSILYIAVNQKYVGYIVVSDKIKIDSYKAIKALKNLGVRQTIMLSGDKHMVANNVGEKLGIDKVYGQLLPEDKLNILESLLQSKSKNGKLIFVGDGINDTPVLARADVGIAMGGLGADAAIDVADVVIMSDETSKIATAINIAKRTRKIVWQNIIFALSVKAFFLILGAFGIATMWEAVIADVGVSVIAILNAMRVLHYKSNPKIKTV